MDALDYQILDAIQKEFPLERNPYDIIAVKLGVSADDVWLRIKELKGSGIIRRLGASLDSKKLGYTSTLAAVSVDPDEVDGAAAIIGEFVEVTHSYQRDGEFNIWFTLIAEDKERIASVLREIQTKLDLSDTQILNVPVEQLFKLDARFDASKHNKVPEKDEK
jgi:siroheme decarboxylase